MERSCDNCGIRIEDDGSAVPLCRECLASLGLETWMHDYLSSLPSPESQFDDGGLPLVGRAAAG